MRPIMAIAAKILSSSGEYYAPFPCKVIEYLVSAVGPSDRVSELYPACKSYMDGHSAAEPQWTLVRADMDDGDSPAGAAAALHLGFSVGMVLAFLMAAACVEVCVSSTSFRVSSKMDID